MKKTIKILEQMVGDIEGAKTCSKSWGIGYGETLIIFKLCEQFGSTPFGIIKDGDEFDGIPSKGLIRIIASFLEIDELEVDLGWLNSGIELLVEAEWDQKVLANIADSDLLEE